MRAFFLVNGINTVPGNPRNWNVRGVSWVHNHHEDARAEVVEYLSGPTFSRVWGQKGRAVELAERIKAYSPDMWSRILVGHSNGADVIRDALDLLKWPKIDAIHLFSAAISNDMTKEGFEKPLSDGRIGKLVIYTASRDHVLKFWARLGKPFGYGELGVLGPSNYSQMAAMRIQVVPRPAFDHSDWWLPENFDWSMTQATS